MKKLDLGLVFWAQSLDNQVPDLIFRDDKELSNKSHREKIIADIYEVPAKVTELNSQVTVRFSDPKFVVKAISNEEDKVGRLAPIVIYGSLPEELSLDWIESSCTEISEVIAYKLARTLSKDAVTTIREWFTSILEEKKTKAEVKKQTISLVTVFLAPLLVGWILQSKRIQPTLIQVSGLIALSNILVMSLQTFLINRSRRRISRK